MINSRDLNELEPKFKERVKAWLLACGAAGLRILIVSTYRDNEYQNYLYSLGRTAEGRICTNAKGGESMHNHRLAVDFCVLNDKRADWTNLKGFTQAGILAEQHGLVWAGRWNGKLKEIGHVEDHKYIR